METEELANRILEEKFYPFKVHRDQLKVIDSVINAKDTIAVFPTGFGKSICYILPPLILDKLNSDVGHIALVISPLNALIDDQVKSLKEHTVLCCSLATDTSSDEINDIRSGNVSIILSTPEAILSKKWRSLLPEIKEHICVVAYDEAHCISEWGLDFRADYAKVGIVQSIVDAPALVLTATITKDIQNDIDRVLGLQSETEIVANLPDRPNMFISITKSSEHYEEELGWVKEQIESCGIECPKMIIYVNSVAACETLYIWLHSSLKEKAYIGEISVDTRLIEMFHANTDQQSKLRIMKNYALANGPIRVLIATVACGMGVDIPDITLVVLWGLPASLLQMWQEMGRGGRDGRRCASFCYAYSRSVSLPCDKCRKLRNRSCSCNSRVYLRELALLTECQRFHILKYLIIDSKQKEMLSQTIKQKKSCNGKCEKMCQCSFCQCCMFCLEKCSCCRKLKSKNDVINSFFKL